MQFLVPSSTEINTAKNPPTKISSLEVNYYKIFIIKYNFHVYRLSSRMLTAMNANDIASADKVCDFNITNINNCLVNNFYLPLCSTSV